MLTELQPVASVRAATAAYRRQSPVETVAAAPAARGFGVIEDIVTLSPQAQALLKNGQATANQTAASQTPDAQTPNADPTTTASTSDAPSDPFRAFRGADGEISLEAVMQIQMLPPHLRKAAELTREAASLRDEINAMAEDPAADAEKLAQLQQEYASTTDALWEELEKLGIAKKMNAADMTMDDLLDAGVKGLVALDQSEDPVKIADDADKTARMAGMTERKDAAADSPMSWALDRGF